jgi:hypothetical protein
MKENHMHASNKIVLVKTLGGGALYIRLSSVAALEQIGTSDDLESHWNVHVIGASDVITIHAHEVYKLRDALLNPQEL